MRNWSGVASGCVVSDARRPGAPAGLVGGNGLPHANPHAIKGDRIRQTTLRSEDHQGISMAQRCDVCGKGPSVGHKISHAHNVTKRRWLVNLVSMRALVKGKVERLRVCTRCLKAGKVVKVV